MISPIFAQVLVISGIALNGIATLTYLIETIRGSIKPNKVTYFLWSIAPIIAFFAQKSQGVGIQSLMTLSVGLFPLSIFIASFFNKKAYWEIKKFDLICGLLSIIGLIAWNLTKIGNIAIFFSIVADLLAMLPTITKSYHYPDTEISWPWILSALSGLFTLFSTQTWKFEYYGFSLYYFIATFLLFAIIQFRVGEKVKKLKLEKLESLTPK